jgi:hypothetical protein
MSFLHSPHFSNFQFPVILVISFKAIENQFSSVLNSGVRSVSKISNISKFYERMSIICLIHKNRKIRPYPVVVFLVLVTKILISLILIKTSNTAFFTNFSNTGILIC